MTSVTQEQLDALKMELETLVAANQADTDTAMTHTWLILCGAMVMFMHAGFAMVESGCCRSGFVSSVLEKNLLDTCTATLGWWAFGWAIAYGDVPDNGWFGRSQWFITGFVEVMDDGSISSGDLNLNWFFQWAFCMTAATIVSGAVAERMQIGGYIIFCLANSILIYPPIVAWTWSCTGWLNHVGPGFMDFAGSGVVHLTGGVGAVIAAKIVGVRTGRFDPNIDQEQFEPHNVAYIVFGTLVLWFGWYGFNCGSTLAMNKDAGRLAAQVAVNTTLSASVSGVIATCTRRFQTGRWSAVSMCGGILGGLVSITAGCGNVMPWAAVVIGAIGACVYMVAGDMCVRMHIDDPVEAGAIHGACGLWGTIACAIFDWGVPNGNYHGWGGFSPTEGASMLGGLGANLAEIGAIIVWSGGCIFILFSSLKKMGFLRIPVEAEEVGLDDHEFSPKRGYTTFEVGACSPKPQAPKTQTVVPQAEVQDQ